MDPSTSCLTTELIVPVCIAGLIVTFPSYILLQIKQLIQDRDWILALTYSVTLTPSM